MLINEKNNLSLVDFVVLGDKRVKIKESQKIEKYLGPTREPTKLWKISVKVMLVVVGWLRKGREQLEISDRIETTKITALLRSAEIFRRVSWDLW